MVVWKCLCWLQHQTPNWTQSAETGLFISNNLIWVLVCWTKWNSHSENLYSIRIAPTGCIDNTINLQYNCTTATMPQLWNDFVYLSLESPLHPQRQWSGQRHSSSAQRFLACLPDRHTVCLAIVSQCLHSVLNALRRKELRVLFYTSW